MPNQSFLYLGETQWASSEAPMNITEGTPIRVVCVYDPALVPPDGEYAWETYQGTNGAIQINLGDWTLTSSGDSSGDPAWPVIQFEAGQFAGINYVGLYLDGNGNQYQFTAEETEWSISLLGAEQTEVANGDISTQASVGVAGAESA